jgi:hypothetical protein
MEPLFEGRLDVLVHPLKANRQHGTPDFIHDEIIQTCPWMTILVEKFAVVGFVPPMGGETDMAD